MKMMEKKLYRVNEKRLLETLAISSEIGATKNNGLNRLALTEEDRQIRDQFVQWLNEENLNVRVDDFGNIYGRREGRRRNAPVVAIGSHLDSQPYGGRFDGVIGVL